MEASMQSQAQGKKKEDWSAAESPSMGAAEEEEGSDPMLRVLCHLIEEGLRVSLFDPL